MILTNPNKILDIFWKTFKIWYISYIANFQGLVQQNFIQTFMSVFFLNFIFNFFFHF